MVGESADVVRGRAERLASLVDGTVEETVARVGGGALPLAELPSFACAVEEELGPRLRTTDPPVVGIVRDGRLLLDCRTLRDDELDEVAAAIGAARWRLTVGTAGHIDHGKTWLVRALTGKDTDRLPEERERGISIELGYAPLELPDGRILSLVDVPGHERFVRTMVAGATGIDLFLLVVDAGEGARPQTHEHLAILRLLGVERGVVAVTKADAVDEETLELAVAEAAELVPEAEVVAVSAKTGAGLGELRAALARAADFVAQSHKVDGPARLYVDRVFTLRGIGTVVTGTLWSGSIAAGDRLRAEPAGLDVRVRSVQVHDQEVDRAEAGRRVALNLPGVERHQLRRGDALVTPNAFARSYRLDVRLEPLGAIPAARHASPRHVTDPRTRRSRRRGARTAAARCAGRRGARRPLRPARRTRRSAAALCSIRRPRARSTSSASPWRKPATHARSSTSPSPRVHSRCAGSRPTRSTGRTAGCSRRSGSKISARSFAGGSRTQIRSTPACPPPAEPWADEIVPLLGLERRGAKLYLPGATAVVDEAATAELEARLESAGVEPVKLDDRGLAGVLEQRGRLVLVGDGYAIGRAAYESARDELVAECLRTGSITLARFRDLVGTSRRPAQLLLERFDADGLTRRVGDARVLRKSARP